MSKRTKKIIKNTILITGIISFLIFAFVLPHLTDIPDIYLKNISILILSATLWLTNVIPPAVTGILIIAITPLFNILSPEKTFSAFGNRAVFFILAAFIMASAVLKTGLAKKLSFYFLKFFSKTPFLLLSGIFSISFFLSLLIPEHATAAILFPFLLQISHGVKDKKFQKLLFLSMAWGAVSGGIGTPLGGARAPFAMGLFQENFGKIITFFEWTKYSFPPSFMFLIFGVVYIFLLSGNLQKKSIEIEKTDLTLTGEEFKVLLIYIFAIILWVFFSDKIDMAVTGLLACFLLFIFKLINWRDAQHYVNWGIIMMYGGAIVLGTSLYKSGTAEYISHNFLKIFVNKPFILFILLLFLTLILTEFISNVATCALLLPVAYGFSNLFDPLFLTLFIAITSGLAFVLPFGSPPNAIAFSSGKYSISDAVKYSIPFFLISPFIIYFVIKLLWNFKLGI